MNMNIVLVLFVVFTESFSQKITQKWITCHCTGMHLDLTCSDNLTCTEQDGLCLHVIERTAEGIIHETRGCLPQKGMVCAPSNNPNIRTLCCDDKDFCNAIGATLPPRDDKPILSVMHMAILIGIISCVVLLLIFAIIFQWRRRKNIRSGLETPTTGSNLSIGQIDLDPQMNLKDIFDEWSTGSGSGQPLLVQRTVARQVQLKEVIGKGRYGEVYRGEWRGEEVAVKKFSTVDEMSWCREAEIYQTVMLRHENILGYIAADRKDGGAWIELWLLTEYHSNGSLFDYLNDNLVSMDSLFKLTASIASGLAHLHMELVGTQGKPPIAHRDLKSKNILVKKSGECAIADLGLAVSLDANNDRIDIPLNNRVGTIRYMSPEVLSDTLNMRYFDSFKRADIYSLGLVLWEISRRVDVEKQAMDYQLPYYDDVPNDPSIEDMKEAVCDKKLRPTYYPHWEESDCLRTMQKVMSECWFENSGARLSALRVKKALIQLRDNFHVV